MKLESYRLSKM